DSTSRGSSLGMFYAGNILGAVTGCLAAGFYLLRVYDMNVATYVAVGINVLVSGAAFLLVRLKPDTTTKLKPDTTTKAVRVPSPEPRIPSPEPRAPSPCSDRHRPVWLLCVGGGSRVDADAQPHLRCHGLHVLDHPCSLPDWDRMGKRGRKRGVEASSAAGA